MDVVQFTQPEATQQKSYAPGHSLSSCGTFISVGEDQRGLATNGYEDPALAQKLAEVALTLIAADPASAIQNIRVVEPRQMGFLPLWEASLVADSPYGPEPLLISVRCKAGSDLPVELEIYDVNHPQLPEWKTDLSLQQVGTARALQYQGSPSFELASLPDGYRLQRSA
jgi:hypothetical protein